MKITITIIEPISNNIFDIQVDNKQRVKTTLKVLSENMLELEKLKDAIGVRIVSSGRQIYGEVTYEEAGIFTGAKLIPIMKKEG